MTATDLALCPISEKTFELPFAATVASGLELAIDPFFARNPAGTLARVRDVTLDAWTLESTRLVVGVQTRDATKVAYRQERAAVVTTSAASRAVLGSALAAVLLTIGATLAFVW